MKLKLLKLKSGRRGPPPKGIVEVQNPCQDLLLFLLAGPLFLLLAVGKDTWKFAKDLYRSDVKKLDHEDKKREFVMNETQFSILESFCLEEVKNTEKAQSSNSSLEPGIV